ncbi:YunG family protein [Actinoplanes regularis]|uniref:YunG family protein n=1 Tax=Actinoplanes regularis TaxID=52697 RepID=UPI002557B39A|nr:hypothetical protein [Actinoplanes regularis]GLW27932.1 hypothetical protein Areg01_08720 [Actinoplanes regularis]
MTVTLLESVLRTAWGRDTCDPHDLADWTPENPARGQCGVTALVVQELLGGELVVGEHLVDGTRYGDHYWNRLPGGRDVDFTFEQFGPGETVVGGAVQQRPAGPPQRCREQYELLRTRVTAALGDQDGSRSVADGETPKRDR